TILQRNADQRALRSVGRLADCFGHFARLAVTESDAAALVAHHHERGKSKTPAALNHLGDAIDVDQPVYKLAVAFFALPRFTRHFAIPSPKIPGRPRARPPPAP